MYCYWHNHIGYTDNIAKILKEQEKYLVFYQTSENSPVSFVSHEIKCVTKEKTPFKITFKEIEKGLPFIIQDVTRLEHLKGYWELELIDKENQIFDEKGRLQRVINMKSFVHIDDEAVTILEIQEQDVCKKV